MLSIQIQSLNFAHTLLVAVSRNLKVKLYLISLFMIVVSFQSESPKGENSSFDFGAQPCCISTP